LIDVGHVAITDAQPIDLEVERQRLQRLLPAAIGNRYVLRRFGTDVAEIEIDGRTIERDVGDDPAVEQGAPRPLA
jgi:hypothetical protein